MATNTGSSEGAGPKTYSIDVRVFLAGITTAMAMAFGIGVAFGPTTLLLPVIPSNVGEMPPSVDKQVSGEMRGDLNEMHVNFETPSLEDLGGGAVQYNADRDASGAEGDEEEHLPAGQHLLVDIKNVEADFLNSEERLADAMVETVNSAGLTMLSYHCHSLLPAGVSCVGVLLESHISFHTWPEEGVITLDLFTCGPSPLLPVVPVLEKLFGVPRSEEEEVITRWSHELRGFRGPNGENYLDSKSDLAYWALSPLEYAHKEQIVSVETPFQRVDIWDYTDSEDTPSYEDALKHNLTEGDPRWLTPEVASPDRFLFLNGALQSIKDHNHELHESLVHPAMFAHPNPKNIAIIGGGEGGSLREILKHNTVESVTMIEIDEMMIEIAREHLTHMNDCSDISGVAKVCFDDEIANIVIEDAHTWFMDRYGSGATKTASAEKFDVVIFDALDPRERLGQLSTKLYTDPKFIDSVMSSLSDDGVIAIKIGDAPTIHDPVEDKGTYPYRAILMNILEEHEQSAAMFVYEEAHCGFADPQSFLVTCKDSNCRSRWNGESDVTDYQIYARIKETVSGKPALIHFDGSTQVSYQMPPRAWETLYCRREPMPFECNYRGLDITKDAYNFDPENEDESDFEIEMVTVDGEEVPTIVAAEDIAKGSYIMPYDLAASFVTNDDVLNNLKKNTEISGTGRVTVIEDFLEFIQENGHKSMGEGNGLTYVEIGASFMMSRSANPEEANVGRWMPAHPSGKIPTYSPVYERHMVSFDVFLVATKDIKTGDKLVKLEDLWEV